MPRRASIGGVPLYDPAEGTTLMQPEVDAPGYWVGAPALWLDGEELYLSVRHRRPLDGGREWKSTIYRLHNRTQLEEVWTCSANELGTASADVCRGMWSTPTQVLLGFGSNRPREPKLHVLLDLILVQGITPVQPRRDLESLSS